MRDIKYRDDGRPEDLLQELGYETQDIAYKKFVKYGAGFFAFFFICIIAGIFIMLWMSPTGLTGGKMADSKSRVEAPTGTPLLQTNISARTDIRHLREQESAVLDASGESKEKGFYHIPIDKAIEEVANATDGERAQMGLPVATPKQGGVMIPVAPETRSSQLSNAGNTAPNSTGDTPFVTSLEGAHGG